MTVLKQNDSFYIEDKYAKINTDDLHICDGQQLFWVEFITVFNEGLNEEVLYAATIT